MACTENCATVNGHGVPQATLVFEAALTALGAASPGTNNLTSLLTWYPYEDVGGFNPLAIEDSGTPSCGWWNTSCVACYCTSQEGGAALAANLLAYAEYSPIVTGLREDLALSRWACVPGLVAGLNFWGTGQTSPITYAFAVHVQSLGCASPTPTPSPSPIPSPTPVAPPPPANNDWLAGLVLLGGGAALLGLWAKRRGALPPQLSGSGGFQRRRGMWRAAADYFGEERDLTREFGDTESYPAGGGMKGFLFRDGTWLDIDGLEHEQAADQADLDLDRDLLDNGVARLWVSSSHDTGEADVTTNLPLTSGQQRFLSNLLRDGRVDSVQFESARDEMGRVAHNQIELARGIREFNAYREAAAEASAPPRFRRSKRRSHSYRATVPRR